MPENNPAEEARLLQYNNASNEVLVDVTRYALDGDGYIEMGYSTYLNLGLVTQIRDGCGDFGSGGCQALFNNNSVLLTADGWKTLMGFESYFTNKFFYDYVEIQHILEQSFKDDLPFEISVEPYLYTRDFLIKHYTEEIASRLHNLDGKLAVICDCTYIYHEKNRNNFYQRKSKSSQKKKPLCEPFIICFTGTDGFVIDLPGPCYARQNYAETIRTVISYPNGLPKLLQPSDVFILDRDFRDVKNFWESLGYEVLMPAWKGNRKQLAVEESND
ncbi:hypothetical protein FQA39_LY10527 [Lamprigera yunnana]|nr:hypothetical protein FQA39_LY10527 [Lamprigera yunnana]